MKPASTIVHASACVIGTSGVLVRGPSGSGKSLLVLRLIERARAASHYAAWIGDDRVALRSAGGRVLARTINTIAGQHELRFHGIANHPYAAQACVDLVVDLEADEDLDRLPDTMRVSLLGRDEDEVAAISAPKQDIEHAAALVFAALGHT